MFRIIPPEAFNFHSIVRIRDIDSVVHNYRILKSKAEKTNSICAVVLKGDVHGLGINDVAPALYKCGARLFFIEDLCEGIELRNILKYDDAKIYVMAGLFKGDEGYFYQNNLIPCLNSIEQIKCWDNYFSNLNKGLAVIHLDTHMNRIGLLDDDVKYLSNNFIKLTSNINIEFYMSHLFDIKGNNKNNSYIQLDTLNNYLKELPKAKVSLSCTDGMVLLDNNVFNLDIVRPGVGLLGGAPNVNSPISEDVKHTFEIYTRISQVKYIKKGSSIGYGKKYIAKSDMKIALAHIGYKDGYLSSLSETNECSKGAYMYIDGHKLHIVGRISLGVSTIDVTSVPDQLLEKYGYVEVVGPNVDIKYLADIVGCYEILMALGRPNKKINDFTMQEFNKLYSAPYN